MNPMEEISREELQRLCTSGTAVEVRAALDIFVQQKREIEAQLAESRADMQAVRGGMLRSGADGRAAQLAATDSGDPEWRARATRALTYKERAIRDLKARLRALFPVSKASSPKGVPERTVRVLRGTPEEVAEEIQCWVDDGWSALNSVVHDGAVVMVFRKDFEVAA